MANATAWKATASAAAEARGGKPLAKRPIPFLALVLTVPVVMASSAALHLAVADSMIGRSLTVFGLTVGTTALTLLAFGIGQKRRDLIRWHVTVTVALTGLAVALTVAVGMPKWWGLTFGIAGLFVACSWALWRIDALRQSTTQGEVEPDPLTKKLGLEATRFGKPAHHFDHTGALTRVEVPVQHGPAETSEVIQAAVPGIESAAAQATGLPVPRGRSRAVPGDGAGESKLVIITKDVLAGRIDWPGPSAPGAPITAPLVSGLYEDQQPVLTYRAGGHPDSPNPAGYGVMGMTRTGKTLHEQVRALEMFSRKGVQVFWFDTIKGAQTITPIRDGLDVVVASDDPHAFRKGLKALKELVRWRADELGRHGYRAWTYDAVEDPRLKMPLVVAHFEEADALLDIAPGDMVWLASKGLSTGVVGGFSLQRADANSMPTGLRFNIGDWSVFGCGDDYSAGFALSDATIAAGAHPEIWKQSKPGYMYREGPGIPERQWPVPAKGFAPSDEEMREHTQRWAPEMTPLDQGSIAALGDWYTQIKDEMAVADGAARSGVKPVSRENGTFTAGASVDPDAAEEITLRQEIAEEIVQARESGDIPAQLDEEAEAIDPARPVPAPRPGDELTWDDGKKQAPTAEAAAEAFDLALRQIADDPELADPDRPGSALFQVSTLVDRYPFRSRPWFSARLSECAEGRLTVPPGLTLTRGDKPGEYRLDRGTDTDADGDGR